MIVMLFVAFEGYHSIREVILGLLASAHKLSHLGLSYLVKRSTFSEANKRRRSRIFTDIYMSVYRNLAINTRKFSREIYGYMLLIMQFKLSSLIR